MAIKILELAKELNINSTLLLEKIKELKTGAKNKNSELDDEQADAVRKLIGKPVEKVEKTVKPRAKKVEEEIEEPKVVVKAAKKVTASPVKQVVEQAPHTREKDAQTKPPRQNIEELLSREKATEKPKDDVKVQIPVEEAKQSVKVEDKKEDVKVEKEGLTPKEEPSMEPLKEEKAKEEESYVHADTIPKVKILKKFDPEAEKLEKERKAAQRKAEQGARDVQKGVAPRKDERKRPERSDNTKNRNFDKGGKDDKFQRNKSKDFKSNSNFDRGGYGKDKDEYSQDKRQSQSRDKSREKENRRRRSTNRKQTSN